jgi:tRNA pseudouridine38-40 synthase
VRTVRLVIEYDGTAFHGWTVQKPRATPPEGSDEEELDRARTVQGTLEAALSALTKEPIRARAASRTDAGVHARGQVVAFETTRDNIPMKAFVRGTNQIMPPMLVVREATVVEDGWDPRRTSRGKRYRYTFWNDEAPSAIDRKRTWHVRTALDLEAMRAAAAHLIGQHDFQAFRSAQCEAKHAIRTVYKIDIFKAEHAEVTVEVVGNAFVRNMVRIIAGNMRDVGLRRITPDHVKRVLESRDRTLGAMTAPPHGLTLEEVIYDDRLPPRPKSVVLP